MGKGDSAGVLAGRYQLQSRLGEGAMGAVYRALDLSLGREVAVKVLKLRLDDLEDGVRERFQREAAWMARHPHPGIVQVFDARLDEEPPFMALQLMLGGDLKAKVQAGGLPLEELAPLGAGLARALGHLHREGILHRDVKPANVLLDGSGTPYLADLGLGQEHGAVPLTRTGMVVGTPIYMALEIIERGRYSAASDLFSLGVMLLELAEGEFLRDLASRPEVVQPRLARLAPPELKRILRRCLRSDPADRYASGEELAAELEALGSAPDAASRETRGLPGTRTATREVPGVAPREPRPPPAPARGAWPLLARVVLQLAAATALGWMARPLWGAPAAAEARPPPSPSIRDLPALPLEVPGGGRLELSAIPGEGLRLEHRDPEGRTRWSHEHRVARGESAILVALATDAAGTYAVLDARGPGVSSVERTGLLFDATGRRLWSAREELELAPEVSPNLRPIRLGPAALEVVLRGRVRRVDRAPVAASP